MKQTGRSALPIGAGVFVACLSLSTLCLAQTAATPPTMSRVTITQVKADMLDEWLDLQKNEVTPALKKAGVRTRTVYSSGLFGTAGEYLTLTPIDKFADFDVQGPLVKALGAEAAARLNAKLRKCTESAHSYAIAPQADLGNALSTPPQGLVTTRFRIAADKWPAFAAIIKSDVLPVYKKANVSFTVNRRGFGGNPNDVTASTGFSKYADLDRGNALVRELGPDGYAKLVAKTIGIATVIDQVVRFRVADLSF